MSRNPTDVKCTRPLKVQIGVRDHWAAETSPTKTSLNKLASVLGRAVVVDPEWQLLLNELGGIYSDKLRFVQVVAGCVEAFANSTAELLEDEEAHEQWIETLLEKTKTQSRLRLFLETSGSNDVAVSWSDQRCGFIINLPKKQIHSFPALYPKLRGDLLKCFTASSIQAPGQPPAADDWAGVEVDAGTGKPTVLEAVVQQPQNHAKTGEHLPNWGTLPRPDDLFLQPPYYLILHGSTSQIVIECSHSPSLKLLSEYLKRWCRVNHNDSRSPPAVNIQLHQSAFGLSEMFDKLELSTQDNRYTTQFQMTSPMLLALIEGVLGYKLLSSQGGTWSFRRETEFLSQR
ncbi:conserved hypothetical protein [Verticillium alfalfae VaMs.102]|uniref:Uncharacterized protein n=1 Tax=Verticillium alfalfae (strain VaMs.102 / ATCC MYA-4576 / FGSC 10136) TaxID=526221 RepID=C9SMZ1_VERA1|nr:conserved hypothetical protein [Verticillium alfalfae VaMs.102]EEY20156.1 conserved hypothetical protein [Verticillium alfalfae VaMs.102]